MSNIINIISQFEYLPLIIVLLPFVFSPLLYIVGNRSEKCRDILGIVVTGFIFLLVAALYPQVAEGSAKVKLSRIMGVGILLKVDMLGYIMAAMTSLMWFLASIYAYDYMFHEEHRNRFYSFMMLTLGGTLGTVMTGDLLSLFIFFEIMSFSSYVLVAHSQTEDAMAAGYNYIYMATFGGLCLLMGVLLYFNATGTMEILPMAHILSKLGLTKYVIFVLFMIGFGIKAGMLPLHIWLPKAHPVAPTPASALLSGVMIKIGAYGILRVSSGIYFPQAGEHIKSLWSLSHNVGYAIIWMGTITMFLGVFMALQQSNAKKMLAYHSISQMGYILMGLGVSAFLGSHGILGFAGGIYHILNHALFKAALFMVVGAVYIKTHELDMYKLGGLWKKMPFTALVCLIAALGITGFPGFNGYASKTLLHHAIVEAYHEAPSLKYAELIFVITSGGTVCSFIKLFSFTFLGKAKEEHKHIKGESLPMSIAMGILALIIMGIGIFPGAFSTYGILPAAKYFSFDYEAVKYSTKYLLHFFSWYDIKGIITAYVLGSIIFMVGMKFHLFHIHFPKWLSVEEVVYKNISKGFVLFCNNVVGRFDRAIDNSYVTTEEYLMGNHETLQPQTAAAVDGVDSASAASAVQTKTSTRPKFGFNMMNLDTEFMLFAVILVSVIIVLFFR